MTVKNGGVQHDVTWLLWPSWGWRALTRRVQRGLTSDHRGHRVITAGLDWPRGLATPTYAQKLWLHAALPATLPFKSNSPSSPPLNNIFGEKIPSFISNAAYLKHGRNFTLRRRWIFHTCSRTKIIHKYTLTSRYFYFFIRIWYLHHNGINRRERKQ